MRGESPSTPFLGFAAASYELDLDVAEGKADPTNAERQRRLRERRKLGLVPVSVGNVRGALPPKRAARVRQWIAETERAATETENKGETK